MRKKIKKFIVLAGIMAMSCFGTLSVSAAEGLDGDYTSEITTESTTENTTENNTEESGKIDQKSVVKDDTTIDTDNEVAKDTGALLEEEGDTPEDTSEKEGWETDDQGHTMYYIDGELVKDQIIPIEYSDEIDEQTGNPKSYLFGFDSDGYLIYGFHIYQQKTYFFDENDTAHKGAALTGFQTIEGDQYSFTSEGVMQKNAARIRDGYTYWYGADGKAVYGFNTINNLFYFFTDDGKMVKNEWMELNGGMYYFGAKGYAYVGARKVENSKYYYYFNSKGQLSAGTTTIGKTHYRFKKGGVPYTGWYTTSYGNKYFYKADGTVTTGVKGIAGKYYYFNSVGRLTGGTATINGVHHRFKPDGTAFTGWFKTVKGNYFFYNTNGTLVKGTKVINKHKYLFSYSSGMLLKKEGWYTTGGNKYYVGSDKYYKVGYKKIDGYYYYFGETGKMYRSKWAYYGGFKYYFNKYGHRASDVTSILPKNSSYVIKVNKVMNTVTVYAKDGDKGYIIPVKAFICSTGSATPTGTFYTPNKYRWKELMGPSYGQWCTRITEGILFHSVWYYKQDNNTLSVKSYNKLGTTCSHGCVRLTCGDAKWIYDNCSLKTKVIIYNDKNSSGPLGKPSAYKLSASHTWDPTDPNCKSKCAKKGCH